ncbi:DUF4292 domain-containing protein [Maribacter sp. 2307ULW6-5]|uniref:DUF4292 domain-containing protein n=1 Tax=Maribacter sp. 2307ULW6-5 TaxID=3386275 RepID=UPI0039BCCCFA
MKAMKTYRNHFLGVALVLTIMSCRSTAVVADGVPDNRLTAKAVVKAHYQNSAKFKTLRGRLGIDYTDGNNSQGVTVSLRMEKDRGIWMSAPLGIFKAYITPERVSFYNKLENEYFDGDFSYLSQLLGTEVDFGMVQNLLLGEAVTDLREQKYHLGIEDNHYRLTPKQAAVLYKTMFRISPKNYKMALQQLSQPQNGKSLQIAYNSYQEVGGAVLPNNVHVLALDQGERTQIDLEYRNVELDRPLNFPYKIPKGFKEIVLR